MKHGFLALMLACALPGLVRDGAQPASINGTWSSDSGNYWSRNDN